MPERLECEVLQKSALYKYTYLYLYLYLKKCAGDETTLKVLIDNIYSMTLDNRLAWIVRAVIMSLKLHFCFFYI